MYTPYLEKYRVVDYLGKGTYGKVYQAIEVQSGNSYALKDIDMKSIKSDDVEKIQTEIALLSKMSHEFIVRFHDYCKKKDHIYIIMHYCSGGDMYSRVNNYASNPYSTEQVFKWFIQTSLALFYIHSNNVIHRDIKPQNLFLDKDIVMVGDFGISRALRFTQDMAKTRIGTPLYVAPEVIKGEPYDSKADVWSLACTFYEILTQSPLFKPSSITDLMNKVCRGQYKRINDSCDPDLKSLIESMLVVDPRKRPSISDILRKPCCLSRIREWYPIYIPKLFPYTTPVFEGPVNRPPSQIPSAFGDFLSNNRENTNERVPNGIRKVDYSHIRPRVSIPPRYEDPSSRINADISSSQHDESRRHPDSHSTKRSVSPPSLKRVSAPRASYRAIQQRNLNLNGHSQDHEKPLPSAGSPHSHHSYPPNVIPITYAIKPTARLSQASSNQSVIDSSKQRTSRSSPACEYSFPFQAESGLKKDVINERRQSYPMKPSHEDQSFARRLSDERTVKREDSSTSNNSMNPQSEGKRESTLRKERGNNAVSPQLAEQSQEQSIQTPIKPQSMFTRITPTNQMQESSKNCASSSHSPSLLNPSPYSRKVLSKIKAANESQEKEVMQKIPHNKGYEVCEEKEGPLLPPTGYPLLKVASPDEEKRRNNNGASVSSERRGQPVCANKSREERKNAQSKPIVPAAMLKSDVMIPPQEKPFLKGEVAWRRPSRDDTKRHIKGLKELRELYLQKKNDH